MKKGKKIDLSVLDYKALESLRAIAVFAKDLKFERRINDAINSILLQREKEYKKEIKKQKEELDVLLVKLQAILSEEH